MNVAGFFDSYRAAFERLDPGAIADHFAYPCHVTSDADVPSLTVAATRDEWLGVLTPLVDAYRSLGVRSADILSTTAAPAGEHVVQVTVHWALVDAAGARVYDFHGIYTLVEREGRLLVSAIAHDELPRLGRALMGRSPGSG